MKITIEVTPVSGCAVTDCAYNVQKECHARAITVGDGAHPGCDTFFKAGAHASGGQQGGVGACKVSGCKFNDDYECQAESIEVGYKGSSVDCLTFVQR